MKKNIWGGGAKTNFNGLAFEKKVDLKQAIINHPTIRIENNDEVWVEDRQIGFALEKHGLYKFFRDTLDCDISKVLSKKLLPDNAFLNTIQDKLYIIEHKSQEGAGSVDEKIQTFTFKKYQYSKMMMHASKKLGKNIDVEYIYVFNDWFKQDGYYDVLDYIKHNGSNYFFNEIPLTKLGIY